MQRTHRKTKKERAALRCPQPREATPYGAVPAFKPHAGFVNIYIANDGDDTQTGFDREKPRKTIPNLMIFDQNLAVHIIGIDDARIDEDNFKNMCATFKGVIHVTGCTVPMSAL